MNKKFFYNQFIPSAPTTIKYLIAEELQQMEKGFLEWYEAATPKARKVRGRYWIVFLMARYSAARISEITELNDDQDIDYRNARILFKTNKTKKDKNGKVKRRIRTVTVPQKVMTEIAMYKAEWPEMVGKVFSLDRSNFYRKMKEIALKNNIDTTRIYPHALRHSRAIEMITKHVPLTTIQQVLGHSSVITTAIYTQISGIESEQILRDRGLI